MEILLYIVLGLVSFSILYKYVFNRKDFKVINYIKKTTGVNDLIAHKFVAYVLTDSLGRNGWVQFRDEILTDDLGYRMYILPLFIKWYLNQTPEGTPANKADQEIVNDILEKNDMSIEEVERLCSMAQPVLINYKIDMFR